jgi:hypothetical protein
MMQQGEVQAQRIRRDYQIQVTDLKDRASDTARDALYQIEDIYTETTRAVEELGIERDRGLFDAAQRRDRTLEDIHVDATRGIDDLRTEYTQKIEDSNVTAGYDLEDLHLLAGRTLEDLNYNTDIAITDLSRNHGYDLSDITFRADELDLRADITQELGTAEFAAGVNQAAAYSQAGSDAITAGYFNAATSAMNAWAIGVNNSRGTPADVSTSTAAWTRP